MGVVNAGVSSADGFLKCRPTSSGTVLGSGMYGSSYVTNGKLVDVQGDPYGGSQNCRYLGDKYTTTYGNTTYDGKYYYWQKNLYLCATWPGTCSP
jgi:hypothetical protein